MSAAAQPAAAPAGDSGGGGGARAAIAAVAGAFVELDAGPGAVAADPLGWAGYADQLSRARARSGEPESVVCGEARIGGVDAVVIAFDFRFLGGSMGEASGRRIVAAFERALRLRRPVVSLVASGGCRMQEGMRALVGMQHIAAACHRARAAGVAHVTVLRRPATGGAWASLAAGADLILALPDAMAGFAGHRVRGGADSWAFTAAGKAAHGQVDQVVSEEDLPATLALALALLTGGGRPDPRPADVPAALGRADLAPDGWTAVQRARAPQRPRAPAYLDHHFDARIALAGDRAGGHDPGMLCGIGRRHGRAVAYAAQAGTANTPAGFRTAARLVRLADRLALPVLTLVDTPGAANDEAAERGGVGPAIADLFAAVAAATVPVTTLVIGEGGSGGALALASPDGLWMTPDSYFSVIAPEAATAILKRPPGEAPAVAAQQRLRPQELVELGVARGIARPPGPAPSPAAGVPGRSA
jgi:acetyl-CoA carboxylase carboxyl transferase subunit beta